MFKIGHERMQKIKQYWLTIAFAGGFVVDYFTLGRVDQLFGMSVLFAYIIISGGMLALLYASAAGKLGEASGRFITRFGPLLVQFTFGNLLSGTLMFYSQSGSWSTSWPFLALLFGVMVGNEMVHNRTQQLLFNLAVFFLGVFSYFVLFIPIFLRKMNSFVFIGSGILSLFLIFVYIKLLRRIIPNFIQVHLRSIVFSIGMIFSILNFLYFWNIIPPIPLSLKHIDIYHSVVRQGDGYLLTYEKGPWYKFWRESDTVYHYSPGDQVYCFASVFAPSDFSLDVFHRWEYYDEKKGEWVTQGRIAYRIGGGRDQGFRGYTLQSVVHAGKWRCTVETARGQVIGRETFTIENGKPSKPLTSRVD